MSVNVFVTLVPITCCNSECGLTFAVPETWQQSRRNDHTSFWCPNGHSQSYRGESTEELLKREVARKQAALDQAQAEIEHQKRRVSVQFGLNTKLRNRVGNGVCPCCNRYFSKLRQHMKSKHPKFAKAES